MSETKYWPVEFGPSYTPKQMLTLGVFEGRYIGAIKGDPSIPKDWFNIEKVLSAKNKKCHAKQRQGLLQWAWNSEKHNFSESQVKNNARRISSELGFKLENKEIAKERVLVFQW